MKKQNCDIGAPRLQRRRWNRRFEPDASSVKTCAVFFSAVFFSAVLFGSVLFGSVFCHRAASAAEPRAVAYLWQSEPSLEIDWHTHDLIANVRVAPDELTSSRSSVRMEAAQRILQAPNSPTLDRPRVLEGLLERLEQGEPEAYVLREFVAAACQLDNGQNAERIWRLVRDDAVNRAVVEQACIDWQSPEPLEFWRARLSDENLSMFDMANAIKGVTTTGNASDVASLTTIASDGARPATLRVLAARAIGVLTKENQLLLARTLHESTDANADLLSISVLGNLAGDDVKSFVIRVAQEGSPAAARLAYLWMCDNAPELADEKISQLITHTDSEVRRRAILHMDRSTDTESVNLLLAALSDPHSGLRDTARVQVLTLAGRTPEQFDAARQGLTSGLASNDWRVIEQCIRLAVELEQPQHVSRFLELLDHERPEVCVSAAWALRSLAVDDPTYLEMLEHARKWTDRFSGRVVGPSVQEVDYRRVAHLLEAFGQRHFEPAQEVLSQYVPKDFGRMGLISRMAGLWANGKFWEKKANEGLTKQLIVCIADKVAMVPEPESIRFAATLALGWLADRKTEGALRKHDEGIPNPIGYATKWALQRLERPPVTRQ